MYKYHLFRMGANLRCYGYKCDRCIKVNVCIIPKLQNWIGNMLFFENMHISVFWPKIKKELRAKSTNFWDNPRISDIVVCFKHFRDFFQSFNFVTFNWEFFPMNLEKKMLFSNWECEPNISYKISQKNYRYLSLISPIQQSCSRQHLEKS